ncbi:hypothetical protein [Labrys wisconsinensis]|uniref:Uncharacterized protein n=1 Tax=Labrys wisconsinensis TaxID=425677 RepID=A0ABU0JQD9_9HYPH|nr:hypothetical protein [Labrys wisconsinensis]MDQ0475484.1 hypothetical protein [Labrys wisconsinensis]
MSSQFVQVVRSLRSVGLKRPPHFSGVYTPGFVLGISMNAHVAKSATARHG